MFGTWKSWAAFGWLALVGCGNAGEGYKPACLLCGTFNDIHGAVSNKAGSQAQMQSWVLASFEYDTGIARVSELDSAGLYTLGHVRTDHAQTLALLSPDYILQGVLSIPGIIDKTIRMYVHFQKPDVPRLTSNGCIMTFDSLTGMTIENKAAASGKGDGTPDGCGKITGQTSLTLLDQSAGAGSIQGAVNAMASAAPAWLDAPTVDTNNDGIPNSSDPDINGDGIINWLDSDANGNGILDIFDPDENSDLVNDLMPEGHNTRQWFTEGVEYISAQYALGPKEDNTGNVATLTFVTKVRSEVTPLAVQIRGAPSLLNSATYTTVDTQGNPNIQAWNRLLADDGQSEDGAANDRIFGRKVTLADGKAPRSNEVIFFQLVFGTPEAPWYVEYPWIFPPIKPAAITAQYDANTRTVMLIGNPFGTIQDFVWTVSIFDASNKVIWTSQATPGSTRQQVLPDNILVTGQTYTYQATAQSLDKVPAHPAYLVRSPKYSVK